MESVDDADWSPDGQAARRHPSTSAIARASSTRSEPSSTNPPAGSSHPRLSPDGRTIAYFEHPERGDNAGRLVLLDVASRKKTIGPTFGGFTSFAWISSDRLIAGGGNGILLDVSRSGEARPSLAVPGGFLPEDVSADGALLARRSNWRREIVGVAAGRSRPQPDVARLVLPYRPFRRRPVPPVRRTVAGPGELPLLHPQDRRLAGGPARKGQGVQPLPGRTLGV